MNYYNLIGTLCLLFWVDLCFAQRLTQPSRGHFGVYSYHYSGREFAINDLNEAYIVRPLRNQVGLTGEWYLGEHFGLGAHVNYSRSKGRGFMSLANSGRSFFIPIEFDIIDYEYHQGILDIYGRWYPQKKVKPLRVFLQLSFGAHILYGGNNAHPLHPDPVWQEPYRLDFEIGRSYVIALGTGLQYRLGHHWGMETAFMITRTRDGIPERPFFFLQYGLQVGVYRLLTNKEH